VTPTLLLLACLFGPTLPADIAADEEVVFFETWGALSADGETWRATLHGVVYEPEPDSLRRDAVVASLRTALELGDEPLAETEAARLDRRVRAFLVDHERGEDLQVRVADQTFAMSKTDAAGRFSGEVSVAAEGLDAEAPLEVTAVLDDDDPRRFVGRVHLVPPTGVSVISDIDDTIKVTDVRDRDELLANTFLREYRAVRGMSEVYAALAAQGAAFHYVSGSPQPLHEPLRTFLFERAGFPAGSLHLQGARLADGEILDLLEPSVEHKLASIRALLAAFPGRRFLLIGDSGEADASIYTTIENEHPDQVLGILIRDVGDADRAHFGSLLPSRARYFRHPEQAQKAAERWIRTR